MQSVRQVWIWQGFDELTNRVDVLTALVREYMETLLEAQRQTSMQLDQAVQQLESLIGRQEVTKTQAAKFNEQTQRLTRNIPR